MEQSTGGVDRRALLKGAATAGMVGAGLAGVTLPAPDAEAQGDKHALQDPNVTTRPVTYTSGGATINAFLARPKARGKHGSVIVMPGIFGLDDYMRETTAQLAQAGLVGLAVDFYSREGGSPKTNDFAQLRDIVAKITDEQILGDLQGGVYYLKERRFTNGKFGVIGFCMGGRIVYLLAATSPDIVAAAPFYGPVTGGPGRPAAMDRTRDIKAAVQGHYGARDMNPKPDDVRAFYAKLKETNPHAEFFIYEGAGHAFHDYSRPSYNAEAAKQAWERVTAFFREHLS